MVLSEIIFGRISAVGKTIIGDGAVPDRPRSIGNGMSKQQPGLWLCSRSFVLRVVFASFIVTSGGAVAVEPEQDYHPENYKLIFNDEFEGNELDRSRWCTRFAFGGGPPLQIPDVECTAGGNGTLDFFKDEQQRYVDRNTLGEMMHQIAWGALRLRVTRSRNDSYASFESAMIRSKATFRPNPSTSYYFAAKLWMPHIVGTWPAFWLTPILSESGEGVWPPEIDIFESGLNGVEDTENMVQMSVKQQSWVGSSGEASHVAPGFDLRYHNFHAEKSLRGRWIEAGLEWTDDSACFFMDGRRILCQSYQWKDNGGNLAPPASILFTLAMGGQYAGRHGVAESGFPTMMQVEYVRVYRKEGPG